MLVFSSFLRSRFLCFHINWPQPTYSGEVEKEEEEEAINNIVIDFVDRFFLSPSPLLLPLPLRYTHF